MEYYSTLKIGNLAICHNLHKPGRSQTQREKYCLISLFVESIEAESRTVVTMCLGLPRE